MVWWAISITFISSDINRLTGFDPLSVLGSGAVLGPKKLKALEYVILGSAVLLTFGYVLLLHRPGRIIRLAVLALSLPLVWGANSWLAITPMGSAHERIQTSILPSSVAYGDIFNDHNIARGEITTYDGFYKAVKANYQRHRDELRTKWNITSDAKLRSVFHLNTVANLFSFGNLNLNAPGGCANLNEQFGGPERIFDDLGVDYYLKSKIGCCSDYAMLVKYLMDRAGIESHMLAIHTHGHIFNEVKIDGKWHALDANIGVLYDRSWNDIIDGLEPFTATMFPVMSMNANQTDRYRPAFAAFRDKILMIAATSAERGVIDTDALPLDIK